MGRRLVEFKVDKDTKRIHDWGDLEGLESETHYIEVEDCCGWIRPKGEDNGYSGSLYLSTHTCYKECKTASTLTLQRYGFNVVVEGY